MFTVPPRRWGGPANDEKRSNAVNTNKRTDVNLMVAVIGGSAVVAMGALTMAITQEQAAPATVAVSWMTVGATSTQTTPPTVPETSMAVPAITGPAENQS